MSRLVEFAVAKRSVTLLLAGALFIAGLLAWGNLKQELLPDIEFPVVTVIAPLPGTGAADVAEQVTKPIERAIAGVPRLEGLQSTSANSLSLVVAQFSFGSDVKEIRAAIEQNLQNAGLPPTVSPTVTALNINASPVIIASIAATSEDGLARRRTSSPTRRSSPRCSASRASAASTSPAARSSGSPSRSTWTSWPTTASRSARSRAFSRRTTSRSRPGQITTDGTKIPVSTIGRIESVAEVENLVVGVKAPAGAGGPPGSGAAPSGAAPSSAAPSSAPAASAAPVEPTQVTIGDVGTVTIEGVATTGYARTNGSPSLSLSVSKTSDANTVQVAEEVTAVARRARQAVRGRRRHHRRLGPLHVHQGVPRRPRQGGRPGRPVRDPDDLPVPVQHPQHDRRRGQHPALDPGGARGHAVHRHHAQHHDPGRPGGRRRAGRRRRDRRPREHLPPPGDGRGPAHGVHRRARRRSRARSPRPRSRRSACSCRSASSAASSPSSSCRSRSPSPSRCSPRSWWP